MNAVFDAISQVTLAETVPGSEPEQPRAKVRTAARAPLHALKTGPSARVKMAGLSWMVMYPLVTLLIAATAPILQDEPIYIRTLVASIVMVPAMTWVIQPRLARPACCPSRSRRHRRTIACEVESRPLFRFRTYLPLSPSGLTRGSTTPVSWILGSSPRMIFLETR